MGAGGAARFGAPESTPASRPFSLMIRFKTSATERTPGARHQSYLPDMTRASPVNLSERVPASFANVAWNPAGCDCACVLLMAHSSGDGCSDDAASTLVQGDDRVHSGRAPRRDVARQ